MLLIENLQEIYVYWNAEIETLTADKIQQLQLERLRLTVARATQSPFYGERLRQAGVTRTACRV